MANPTWEETEPIYEETTPIEATPSVEDLYQPDIPEETSTAKGLLSGAQKSATFGFSDELAALAGAAGASSGGDPRAFWDVYKDILGDVREENKAVDEQAPIASLAGELIGGLLIPSGVFGTAAKGASLGQRTKALAQAGALGGAAAGLGTSEADLVSGEPGQLKEAAQSTLSSAGVGGILGGVMPVVGSKLKQGKELVSEILPEFQITKDIGEVFTRSKNGQELLGMIDNFGAESKALAEDIMNKFSSIRHVTGKLRQLSLEEQTALGRTFNIEKELDDIMQQSENMLKGASTDEIADIKDFQAKIKALVNETKTEAEQFIKLEKPLKPSREEKAIEKVTKKTAEAEAKDKIKVQALKEALATAIEMGDDVSADKLRSKIDNLTQLTEFPGEVAVEELTQLPVAGVSRGPFKAPITEAILPENEGEIFPQFQKLVSDIVERDKEITPDQLEKIRRELKTFGRIAKTPTGEQLATKTRQQFRNMLEQPVVGDTDEAASLRSLVENYQQRTKELGQVIEAQERHLQLPRYLTDLTEKQKGPVIENMQNAIREYSTLGTQGRERINSSLTQLEKSFPVEAKQLRDQIQEMSTKERLSKELVGKSAFGLGPVQALKQKDVAGFLGASAKAATLQTSRLAGKGAKTAIEASKNLIEGGARIYNSSPESIQKMIDFARNQGANSSNIFANTLEGIVFAPDAKRRALLFTLMQQPQFREFADSFFKQETPDDLGE